VTRAFMVASPHAIRQVLGEAPAAKPPKLALIGLLFPPATAPPAIAKNPGGQGQSVKSLPGDSWQPTDVPGNGSLVTTTTDPNATESDTVAWGAFVMSDATVLLRVVTVLLRVVSRESRLAKSALTCAAEIGLPVVKTLGTAASTTRGAVRSIVSIHHLCVANFAIAFLASSWFFGVWSPIRYSYDVIGVLVTRAQGAQTAVVESQTVMSQAPAQIGVVGNWQIPPHAEPQPPQFVVVFSGVSQPLLPLPVQWAIPGTQEDPGEQTPAMQATTTPG
jgi:hypothetical protein